MKTAVDANVILDALTGTTEDIRIAHRALIAAKTAGSLIISVVAYAEVAARFRKKADADDFFGLLACEVQPLDEIVAFRAGHFFRDYRKRGGKRTRILAGFLIAAHARLHADRILTRDARFFGGSFPGLIAVAPADLSS